MDKKLIWNKLLDNVKRDLASATDAKESTSSFKFESDMKQESKYDTRSIEAGYLAEGQARRVEELKLELKLIEEIPLHPFKKEDEIAVGALLDIELNGRNKLYFLSTTAGGTVLDINGEIVLVISVFSPIGSSVMGLKVGDSFELETQAGTREYKIRSVC